MSQEIGHSDEDERKILPIERGFPIERVNEIAEKEGRAKMYYRPIYTMHKWWARRLGCVFRTISLYSLLDDPENVDIRTPSGGNESLDDYGESRSKIEEMLDNVDETNPESLWSLYPKDVQVGDKRILDPFMGGGTPVVEASRFGAEVVGNELNPVAWFIGKKELEAGEADLNKLDEAFEEVKEKVSNEIKELYRTDCPHSDHTADITAAFWVKELDCASCGDTVPLFKDYRVGKGRYENKGKYNVYCPECETVTIVDDWRSESVCNHCEYEFIPEEGTAGRGKYTCSSCGQKYQILDAIAEQDGFSLSLYGLEYYCSGCDSEGREKSRYRGYKSANSDDIKRYSEAVDQWEASDELNNYVPDEEIPLGIKTDSTKFEGSIGGGFNVLRQGYDKWTDMYNSRQLLCLSKLLAAIDEVEDQSAKEYLLLAFSDSLRTNCMMTSYNFARNGMEEIFRTNSFNPPLSPAESNVWGSEYGRGTFKSSWRMVRKGVEYAKSPTERHIVDGETVETDPFSQPIGENSEVRLGDAREITDENEYDAILTDPPYYDNVIYSELSNFFYVWLKQLLEDEYEGFDQEQTPQKESIVANPAVGKGEAEFESEIKQAFAVMENALKDDGVLSFTYHHSSSESWGELLSALCDAGFEVTASYPITADVSKLPTKLGKGEAVEFDIIIIARPAKEREAISWNSLRRNIYRTAQRTRQRLEENRDLSRGDIGVVEMGRCFHEYSKHHGKVERAGETMTAKEVVDEIYGVIQHGSDIGEIDVFLDLLETPDASYDDLNKLSRGTNATPERMEDMRLYRMDDGFKLGTWDDEKRIAYIQSRVDSDEELTDLDKAQFLRYRWEHGKSVSDYLSEWEITDDLRELCEGLADATGDDTYRNILESRLSDY